MATSGANLEQTSINQEADRFIDISAREHVADQYCVWLSEEQRPK
jgi:hypothetical protein